MNKAIYFIAAGLAAIIMSVIIIKADTPDTTPVVISGSQALMRERTSGTVTSESQTDNTGKTTRQQGMTQVSVTENINSCAGTQQSVSANSVSDTSGMININKADVSMLVNLKGIGEKKAAAIIEYREANGGFSSIDEIKNVKGIGEKTFENIKEFITV
ncbi:MAG: ComEA family DNA-binding protein [Oscillospiraceae bacterium]|nr:ComEA family DNA-binding protein [Oscillospiraceae bacterium]